MDDARRLRMEHLAGPMPLQEFYGTGAYPAGGGGYGVYDSGLQAGREYRGLTIMPRNLGTPRDSVKLRFLDPVDAKKVANKIIAKEADREEPDKYTLVQKVMDGISSRGCVPLYMKWAGSRFDFDLDFLDSRGLNRTLAGSILPSKTKTGWTVTGAVVIVPLKTRVPDGINYR